MDEDEELTEEEIEEELIGHKRICTCDEDPDWCQIHNGWA